MHSERPSAAIEAGPRLASGDLRASTTSTKGRGSAAEVPDAWFGCCTRPHDVDSSRGVRTVFRASRTSIDGSGILQRVDFD